MAFITEKEELKPGLILFRRGDVDHRMWYCRMKMPKADRYKTVSLKTNDINAARERASRWILQPCCSTVSSRQQWSAGSDGAASTPPGQEKRGEKAAQQRRPEQRLR